MRSSMTKSFIFILLIGISLISSMNCHALPFTIVPKAPLPTEVLSGGFATAFYTVTNNTNGVRVGNFVKYLPPNVTQITTDITTPNLCGATFTLQPHGSSGDSCTLELRIVGPVTSSGCDIKHHLLICIAGGISCAGTQFPLDVVQVNIVAPNMLAVGNYSLIGPLTKIDSLKSASKKRQLLTPSSTKNNSKHNLSDGAQPALIVNTTSSTSWTYVTAELQPSIFTSASFFSVSCANTVCATVGQYNTGNGFQPGIIVSANDGITWRYIMPSNPPGIITNSNLNSVACTTGHCVTVGYYNVGSGTQLSLITSADNGNSWQFLNPANSPGTTVAANLNTVICPGNRCIAVGQYNRGTGNGFEPAVIVSNDNGANWSFVNPTGAPSLFTSMALSTVDCAGDSCAVVGQYNTGSGTQPCIIVSSNNGPWHFVNPSNSPGTIRSARLRNVRCTNSTCVAVGEYNLQIVTPVPQPAVIISTDDAATWKFIQPSNSPGSILNSILASVDCSSMLCAAVGQYNLGQGSQPAIIVSSNPGVSWHYASISNAPGIITNSILNDIFCKDIFCIAVGKYDVGQGTQPALITTRDGGISWHFINPKHSPGKIISSNLSSVDCKGQTCAAVGQYDLGKGTQPLIIASRDEGVTWEYVNPTNSPGSIQSGTLNSVAALP